LPQQFPRAAERTISWQASDQTQHCAGGGTAAHLKAFSAYFVRDVDVERVQIDELFALLRAVKDGEASEKQAIKRLLRSLHWVWVAMDPVCKVCLAVDVGECPLATVQRLVHQVSQRW
jgi:hypothetical protein